MLGWAGGLTARVALALVAALSAAGWAAAQERAGTPYPADTAAGSSPAAVAGLPTIETQDPALAATLARLIADRSPGGLVEVAGHYRRLGVDDRALDYYSDALVLDAWHAAALDGRARVWRDTGFPGRALGDAYRAVYFAPGSAPARNTLGTILQALGRHEDAADAYRRAVALDGAAIYAMNNLCYLAFLDGRSDLAVEACRTTLQREAAFAPARNNLALAYAALGEPDRARAEFLEASGAAAAHYNMGIVHLARREYAAAAVEFEAAYGVDPSLAAARRRFRQARRLAAAGGEAVR